MKYKCTNPNDCKYKTKKSRCNHSRPEIISGGTQVYCSHQVDDILPYYQITDVKGGQPLVLDSLDEIEEYVNKDYGEIGDAYTIKIIGMTKEKFASLPEWGGF